MLRDPVLECDWNVLSIYNSQAERNRVVKINPNLRLAPYPLTREYLNSYFDNNKFELSGNQFIRDCSASMYSYFVITYGYTPKTVHGGGSALPAVPGGSGISYGFNPYFGLFDIDSPILWFLLIGLGIIVIKKYTD